MKLAIKVKLSLHAQMIFLWRCIVPWYTWSWPLCMVLRSIQNLQRHAIVDKVGFVGMILLCLLFSQVKIFPLEVFKKQLHISAKLIKNRNVIVFGIIRHLSLTEEYDRDVKNINIWYESALSIFIVKDCDFEINIVTHVTKFIFIFVNFVNYDNLFWVLVCLWLNWLQVFKWLTYFTWMLLLRKWI